jgi:hypothetical protein
LPATYGNKLGKYSRVGLIPFRIGVAVEKPFGGMQEKQKSKKVTVKKSVMESGRSEK